MFGEETQDVEVLPQSITAIPGFVTLRSLLGKPGNGDVFGVGSLLEFVCVRVCVCKDIFSGGGKRGVDLKCAVNDPLDT